MPVARKAACAESVGAQDEIARGGLADHRQRALSRQKLAARRNERRAEAGFVPGRGLFLGERHGLRRTESRLQALAIGQAHVDAHVRAGVHRHVAILHRLRGFAALAGVGIEKGRQAEQSFALDDPHARRHGRVGLDHRFDASVTQDERGARSLIAGAIESHVANTSRLRSRRGLRPHARSGDAHDGDPTRETSEGTCGAKTNHAYSYFLCARTAGPPEDSGFMGETQLKRAPILTAPTESHHDRSGLELEEAIRIGYLRTEALSVHAAEPASCGRGAAGERDRIAFHVHACGGSAVPTGHNQCPSEP